MTPRDVLHGRIAAAGELMAPTVAHASVNGTDPASSVLVVLPVGHPAVVSLGAAARRLPSGAAIAALLPHGAARTLASTVSPELARRMDVRLGPMESLCLAVGDTESLVTVARWHDMTATAAMGQA